MRNPFTLLTLCLLLGGMGHPTQADPLATPTVVPFLLVGNSIIVEASVNGQSGHFLLDTGSPYLILNGRHFEGVSHRGEQWNLLDIHGQTCPMAYFVVRDFRIGDMKLRQRDAYVTDLSGLEAAKGCNLAGIIGYSALRQVEIVLDFENLLLWLVPLDKKGRRKVHLHQFVAVDSFRLRMSEHISYIVVEFNGKRLRLGIDSGSEVNMINRQVLRRRPGHFTVTGHILIRGINHEVMPCGTGIMESIAFEQGTQANLDVTIADMSAINQCLETDLHGLLGVPFLMQGQVAINFRRKKLYLGQSLSAGLARSKSLQQERNLAARDK